MKIRKRPLAGSQASVLMISLLLCVIMGISLASYLTLTRNQLFSVRRSQSWNASLSISEAGIEEGLMASIDPELGEAVRTPGILGRRK